jgi:hypothetical protein
MNIVRYKRMHIGALNVALMYEENKLNHYVIKHIISVMN